MQILKGLKMNQEKVLITGINGFAGTHLKNLLLKKSYDVYGISRHSDNEKTFEADVTDARAVTEAVKKSKPQKIFHLAGQSSVGKSLQFPEVTEKTSADGTRNIFDACLKNNMNPKILVVSSSEVYGKQEKFPVKEDAVPRPMTSYAKSKLNQEKICLDYFKKYGMNIVISRSFSHTGPGQKETFVCPNFAMQIAKIERKMQNPIIKVGNLDVARDFSDVRDIVVAYGMALEKCKSGEIYNICSSKAYKIKELLNMMISMSNVKIKIDTEKNRLRGSDIPYAQGDNTKFCKQTGWKPKIKIEQTLKDLLDFSRDKISQQPL